MGAYGLTVAAAFAVALAVLLSVSTSTVEAEVRDTATGSPLDTPIKKNNGDTVYIHNGAGGFVLYEITAIGNASASFTHSSAQNDGQTLYCSPATTTGTCDANTADGTTVAVKIDKDSGSGGIIVKQTVLATGVTTADELAVSVAPVPTKLTASPSPKAISAGEGSDTADESTLTFRLTDQNGKGIGGKALTVIASHGELEGLDDAPDGWTDVTGGIEFDGSGTQVGTVTTSTDTGDEDVDGAGYAAVKFTAGGVADIATITVRLAGSTLTQTADIVMYGAAKTITAAAEQTALQIGGSTFIVVTATDAGGNAVAGHPVDVKSGASGVVGPEARSNEVVVRNVADKDVAPIGGLAAGAGDLPACGDAPDRVDVDGTDVNESLWWTGNGTNAAGKCVIQVTTAGANTASTADDTTRGTHTITIAGPAADGSADVTVEIEIGGAPATITSDAPERMDPLSEITVNLTVLDDEDVRVGSVHYSVVKVSDDGVFTSAVSGRTSDGRAKFSYLAPSSSGTAQFLVRTWNEKADGTRGTTQTAREQILIEVGEAMPEEPDMPAMPDGDATLTVQGNIGSFSGGSLDAFAAAAAAECPGGSQIAVQDADGEWHLWSSTAPAFAIIGFTTAFADGFDGMTFVWVSSCEADAMDSEGSMGSEG